MKKWFIILVTLLFISGNSVFADIDNQSITEYNKYLRDTISSNLNYEVKGNAKAAISFTLNKDGSVENIKVTSSGDDNLNNKLIEAVQKSAPFKPFPSDFKYDSIDVNYNYDFSSTYSLNNNVQVRHTPASQQPDYQYYYKVRELIRKRFPTSYSWLTESIVFEITILPSGAIKKVDILSSSGSKRYDNNVIKALTSYRLPKPPEALRNTEIKYTFDMNKNTRIYPPIFIPVNW